jgi:malonyl-CoA decarboxylase
MLTKDSIESIRPIITRLCKQYLLEEKRRGDALDPVANFHLRNGAFIDSNICWNADTSPKGWHQSFGLMINYHYQLDQISSNRLAYLNGTILSFPSSKL